jgi:hypothetical protein
VSKLRKKSLFGRVGILALVIALLALGTGAVYGMWSQAVSVNYYATTGTLSWALVAGTPTTTPSGGSITDLVSGNVISVTITNPSNTYTYTAPFTIKNTGTIPIRIQSITFTSVPTGVTPVMTGLLKGDQIDPGITKTGQISVGTGSVSSSFTFNATILPVQWSLYVP